jgi:hypothetical protein
MRAAALLLSLALPACSSIEPSAHIRSIGEGGAAGSASEGGGGSAPDPGTATWMRTFGGAGVDGLAAVSSSSWAIALTGSFEGTIDLGGGPLSSAGGRDGFVAVLDPTGEHLWSRRFGGPGDDEGAAVTIDVSDSVLLAASFAGTIDVGDETLTSAGGRDILVARFHPGGNLQWLHGYGGPGDEERAAAVAFDVACNGFVAGSFEGSLDLGGEVLTSAGQSDAFVVKLDVDGIHQWSMALGAEGSDRAEAIAVGVVAPLIGGSWGATDGDPGDAFVASIRATGELAWTQIYQGSMGATRSLYTSLDGASYAAGDLASAADFGGSYLTSEGRDGFVAAIDATGALDWARAFGGMGDQTIAGIAAQSDRLLIAGTAVGGLDELPGAGGDDGFVAVLDTSGETLWSLLLGDAASQRATGVAHADGAGAVVVGDFEGAIELGGAPLSSAGASDGWAIAFTP